MDSCRLLDSLSERALRSIERFDRGWTACYALLMEAVGRSGKSSCGRRSGLRRSLLLMLCSLLFVAQLGIQLHASEHGAGPDTSCISCAVGGNLEQLTAAPAAVAAQARINDPFDPARHLDHPVRDLYRAHCARAPPEPLITA